jgi:hypothetical protein
MIEIEIVERNSYGELLLEIRNQLDEGHGVDGAAVDEIQVRLRRLYVQMPDEYLFDPSLNSPAHSP